MKKKILIISIMCLLLSLLCIFSNSVNAVDLNTIYDVGGDNSLNTQAGDILGLIQVIGYVAAIFMAVFIGIKYLLAAPEGKAEAKKSLTPWLIGCLILTAGSVIVSAIAQFARNSVTYQG